MQLMPCDEGSLKSNMDRFIGNKNDTSRQRYERLKSNMDRFIAVCDKSIREHYKAFKIQYG